MIYRSSALTDPPQTRQKASALLKDRENKMSFVMEGYAAEEA